MPVFSYKALDAAGKTQRGIMDAESLRGARQKLRARGLFPTEVMEDVARAPSERKISLPLFFERVKAGDLVAMTRYLATLQGAGVPLVQSLTAIILQTKSAPLKRVMTRVREEVNQGSSLADALALYPRLFPPLYVSMVRAGEAGGALDVVLLRLADFTSKQHQLRNKILAALAYPVLMTAVGLGVLGFLLTSVIPTVMQIFKESQQTLPLPTRILIGGSDLISQYYWLLLLGVAAIILLAKSLARTQRGRVTLDRLKFRVPLLGTLMLKEGIARFSRTLGMLVEGGVPLLYCLEICRHVVDNSIFRQELDEAILNVERGGELSLSLEKGTLFPPLMTQMIAMGERSGRLSEMLNKVAESYESEVETTVQGLTAILEPVLILLMGGVVGFVVLSVLLPLFEISQLVR